MTRAQIDAALAAGRAVVAQRGGSRNVPVDACRVVASRLYVRDARTGAWFLSNNVTKAPAGRGPKGSE